MLADLPLSNDSDDQLGFRPFADAIAGIIDSPRTATPLVMATNAKWGAGKTSLGLMIKKRLEAKPAADGNSPHVTCWFSAWMHDDSPNLATSLAAEVARTADRSRPMWRRFFSPVSPDLCLAGSRRLRKLFLYVVPATLILACTLLYLRAGYSPSSASSLNPWLLAALTHLLGYAPATALIAVVLLLFQTLTSILPVAKSLGEFVRDPQSAAKTASMTEVRRQIGNLIHHGTPKGSKFVIFIDDLDRCRPPRSVDILEVVNQLLDHPRVVVMLMADMQVVAECAAIRYSSLARGRGVDDKDRSSISLPNYSWDYLQKVVQLQFDLPTYPTDAIRTMVSTLAKQVPDDEGNSRLWKVLAVVRRRATNATTKVVELGLSFWFVTLSFGYISLFLFLKLGWLHWRLGQVVANGKAVSILVGILCGALSAVILRRANIARNRRMLDGQIKARIAAGEKDFSRVEAAVKWHNKHLEARAETRGLLRERLQRYLEDESELQREAEDEVMRHLEPVPRHAKRLLNRLRLLLFIAHERRMFGGKPPLTPRHIGKWAVLCERWPELAHCLLKEPGLIRDLENSVLHTSAVSRASPVYKGDASLERFCISDTQTWLADVVERIAEFRSSVPAVEAVQRPTEVAY